MYHFDKSCCICINKSDLKHLFEVDSDGVSHYNKLTSSIAEMNFKEMNDQRLICGECCVKLNTVYIFRRMCLRSKTNLITYISQLQTSGHISGTVCLKDIKPELIVVKNRGGSDKEGSNCFEGSNPQIQFHTESSVENIGFSASVKKEFESEDDDSSALADATVDHVNGDAHKDVKVEDVEHQTIMEDSTEYYKEFNKIEIEDHQLKEVKAESMSDTEIPQDGSTSQADIRSSEKPKRSEEITIGIELRQNTANEDATVDHVNDGAHSDVKVEEVEDQTIMEAYSECYTKFKIEIKEHNLEEVKEEPMADTETPQDGSTSQADIGTSEEAKGSEETTIGTEITQNTEKGNERLYQCEICQKSFNHKDSLMNHMQTHSSKTSYVCKICKKIFNNKSSLTVHMNKHSTERPYECEICKKGYNYKRKLTDHMKTHSSKRPYECEICKKGYIYKSKLTDHMKTHSIEKLYECEICKKGYNYKSKFTDHMKTHSSERPFECEICKKGFNFKCNLTEHMNKHSNERLYECELCKKGFYSKNSLIVHMKTHSSERPYECEICKKGYNYKSKLSNHMKTHSSERPFECEICKKGFNRKSNLTAHMIIHSSERPYECEICKKGFNYKWKLTEHMKLHTSENPYECEICKKCFNQKGNLTVHMNIHSNKKLYECGKCKKSYNDKSNLIRHMKTSCI